MSFGGTSGSTAVSTAVSGAWNSGDVLVGTAGNAGAGVVYYPARYSNVIAVSGTTTSDGLHEDSNYGTDVDVSAPYFVKTLHGRNATITDGGTSYSAPHVAGVAALIWARHPAWSNSSVRAQVESAVEDLGGRGWDSRFGHGRIDACFGVEAGCASIYKLGASIVGDPTYAVPPGQTCEWQAHTEGGRLPLSYSWTGILSGSLASVSGQLEEGGGGVLKVTVTSYDGQKVVKSITVTVDEDADDCRS